MLLLQLGAVVLLHRTSLLQQKMTNMRAIDTVIISYIIEEIPIETHNIFSVCIFENIVIQ